MTLLTVWPESDSRTIILATHDPEVISQRLAEVGVEFTRWEARDLPDTATAQEVLAAYADEVADFSADKGFVTVDAVAMTRTGSADEWATMVAGARGKFLSEHTHEDDEVRYFARGAGVFYLRINTRVHAVLCTVGDLISVPKDTRHWFDMGSEPDFAAIRFFREDDGWVGHFTGDTIAERFPDFDALASSSIAAGG